MDNPNPRCRLCRSRTEVLNASHPGYQLPKTYVIVACANCDTQYADPMEADEAVYEVIYAKAEQLPGYARYTGYADEVTRTETPLQLLASAEDVYWFIADALEQRGRKGSDRMLEIGSGLGYLTYSLAKSGYNIRGLELSTKAVAAARARYGDLYDAGDLFQLTRSAPGTYDVVILTEVIEHLSDPISFLEAARGLLAPGGVILLTTPNKSLYPAKTYWQTDNPPVHLWWFSEASMRQIAIRLEMQIHFGDFTAFNTGRMVGRPAGPPDPQFCPPILDADGGVVLRGEPGKRLAARRATAKVLGEALSNRVWTLRDQARGAPRFFRERAHLAYARSYSMGVALSL